MTSCRCVVAAALLLPFLAVIAAAPPRDPVSQKARDSAERAIRWLLDAQNRDGSWGDNAGSRGEVGNTCIAALALLGHGSTPTRGPHWHELRRGLDWLRVRTNSYGEGRTLDEATLLQRKLGDNADLYLVTLLYSEVVGMNTDSEEDRKMQQELGRMTARIASLQQPNGEWETSYEPMLTTILAWLALKQAHAAGITIKQASPGKVVEYLRQQCLEPGTGVFREQKWGRQERFVTQAGGLRVLNGSGLGQTDDARKATQVLVKMRFDQDVGGATGGEEFLGALFATQALYLEHDAHYAAWYPRITDALVAGQNRDGSWMGHHCITGKVFCTACSILAMLTPDKLLPMVER